MKIIHRDLKPDNILISSNLKELKLLDLGVSTYEEDENHKGAVVGTMRYMSPEQLGGKLSFKSDIWSYGCILLDLCTQMVPF
jgi:serine/threonine protein kinase